MRRCWLYVTLVCEICCCLLDTSCQYIMQAADNTLYYSGPQCREILLMSCSSVCDQLQSRHQVYQQSQDWLLISINMIQLLFWDEHLFSHMIIGNWCRCTLLCWWSFQNLQNVLPPTLCFPTFQMHPVNQMSCCMQQYICWLMFAPTTIMTQFNPAK